MYAGAPQTLSKIKQVKAFFFSNYFPNLERIFVHISSVRAPVLGKVTFKSNALQYCVTP